MTDRSGRISRAQLLQGVLATGALSACGGGSVANQFSAPTPTPGLSCVPLTSNASDRFGLNKYFAADPFRQFDKQKLFDILDPSPRLDLVQAGYFKNTGRHVVEGNVIQALSSTGGTITSPGTYTLGGDINWTPSGTSTAAITIAASNVVLDLGGHTISATIADKSIQTTAILLAGVENITIKNGNIAGFTEYGVQARQTCGLAISGINVSGLCLANTSIRQLTPAGIFVGLSTNVSISQCNVSASSVTTDAAAGIQLISTVVASVSNCSVSSFVNNDGGMQGYSYVGCDGVITTNCTAQTLQTFFNGNIATTGHTCIGFLPTLSQNLTFTGCSATGITGCCDDCHGLSVFLCAATTVSGCHASQILDGVNNLATHPQTGAKATGIEVYSLASTGPPIVISDCTVDGVRAINPEDLQAAGFSAWGPAIQFLRCSSSNVSVQNDKGAKDMRGIGFGWAPDPRPAFWLAASFVTYTNCTATNCDVAFDTWDHVFSTWTNPTYTNCPVGFLVEPLGVRTISCDACSECPGLPYSIYSPGSVSLLNVAIGNTHP